MRYSARLITANLRAGIIHQVDVAPTLQEQLPSTQFGFHDRQTSAMPNKPAVDCRQEARLFFLIPFWGRSASAFSEWRVIRPEGSVKFLLGDEEEGAILRQMNNENAEVESFFTGYETANEMFDVEQIAAFYADIFMFGGPEGVQSVKKEDFVKVLPRRKEFFRSRGLVASKIDSLEASTLDSKYTLVKVIWNMRFDRRASEPIYSHNAASYILSRTDDRFQIVFQIDHEDLGKRVQELRLE